MDFRESAFEHTTELFYEAAATPELWPKALQSLADSTGSMGANLMPIRPGPDMAITSPSTRGFIESFVADGWLRINPYMRRGLELTQAGFRGLITQQDMLTAHQIASDPYVNEVEVPFGYGPKAGMVLVAEGQEMALPMTIERGLRAGPFSSSEIQALNRLMAILQPAARLALRIGFEASKRIADGLAAGGLDVALIGASGRVLHIAPGLERYVGDVFDLRGGVLSSWENRTEAVLAAAIRRVVSYAPAGDRQVGPIDLPRRGARQPLKAQLVPVTGAAHDVFMLARAVMIITDPEVAVRGNVATIAAAYRLSPSEARLACRVGDGETLKHIAEAEGITLETVRARLKAVFAKTGTHRQAELALLVSQLLR